ncbi:MAG: hypothetical protein Q9213_004071 [Squamulea squamosa]
MSPPPAKRACLENTLGMPADPTTPIDDSDDLYDDYPAINRYPAESTPQPSEEVTVQRVNPSSKPSPFQLPGLGLFAHKESNSSQELNGDKGLLLSNNTALLPPVGKLRVTQSTLQSKGKPSLETCNITPGFQEKLSDGCDQLKSQKEYNRLDDGPVPILDPSTSEDVLAGEQYDVDDSKSVPSLGIEGVEGSAEQLLAKGLVRENIAEGLAGELSPKASHDDARRNPPQATDSARAASSSLDVHDKDSFRPMEAIEGAGAAQRLAEERGGDEPSDSEPATSIENRIDFTAQPSTNSMRRDGTAEQRVGESTPQSRSTPQRTHDNVEGDLHQDVDTLMALSDSAGIPQATYAPQVEPTEAATYKTEQTFEEVAEANKENGEAEFELDSSPIESSSESESESSSSSSGDSDYEMLDPEEEARRLMQDGGSDDEDKGGKAPSGPLRTLNEKPDEIVPKPQVDITPDMTVSELGNVEHLVENSILIKGKTSGESRALESGSLLCLADRSVVGVVAELLGQVQHPYYSVRFTNPTAIAEAGISKGTSIFYVEQHSSYVFTQNLKALKGSDASNMHDEEVGDDELEFSDDEAEAEHKRRAKQERQARRGDREERGDRAERGSRSNRGARGDRHGKGNRGDGFSKGPRGGYSQGRGRGNFNHQTHARDASTPIMNYDDINDGEDLYTPLARPSNLHEIMGRGEAPQEDLNNRINGNPGGQGSQRGRPDRGRGRGDRGRGDRGRVGRGGRGDGRDRGGYNGDSRNGHYNGQEKQYQSNIPPSPQHTNGYLPYSSNGTSAPPQAGWPHQYTPNQSNPPLPPYQNPLHIPQQQTYSPYPSNPYVQPHTPSQYPYPPHQSPLPPPTAYNHQYAPYQASSPTSPIPPNIPAGAYINPAFFAQQALQQNHGHGSSQTGASSRSPQSEEAFRAAQDRLDVLRHLTRNAGSPT